MLLRARRKPPPYNESVILSERGPQAYFSLGVVSRKPALSVVEGALRLLLEKFAALPRAYFEDCISGAFAPEF